MRAAGNSAAGTGGKAEEWDEAYNVWQLMAAEHQAQISNANARSAPAASPSVVAAQQLVVVGVPV